VRLFKARSLVLTRNSACSPIVRGLLCATFVAALSACSAGGPFADNASPLALHVQARGGAAAVRGIEAIALDLNLVEPKFALQATYLENRSNCMRIDVFDRGTYLQSEGVSSRGGWEIAAGAASASPQPPGGTETLLHGIDNPVRLIGLDEFPARGHQVTYAGRTTIDATTYDRFSVVYRDGYTADVYLDATTHLIAKMREQKPMHLATDPTKLTIETQFSDYRRVSGVMFPFFSREVNWQTGEELGHATVKSIRVNSPDALTVCEPKDVRVP
jgi:hypothetical protein